MSDGDDFEPDPCEGGGCMETAESMSQLRREKHDGSE